MKKSLILSALASSILLGCGGGGGGSSSAPGNTTKYNFEFVEFADAADAPDISPKVCTLFDTDLSTPGMESFARLAENVRVETYDQNGNFYKELDVTEEGKLVVSDTDVPDNGYLSVVDSPDDSIHNYKVLSIHKSMLSDMMISVKRPQGSNSSCHTSEVVSTKTGHAFVTATSIATDGYAFNSALVDIDKAASATAVVETFDSEEVLVRAYNGDILSDYIFVSEFGDTEFGAVTPLSGVNFESKDWTNGIPANGLTSLDVRLSYQGYSYPWLSAEFDLVDSSITSPISVTPLQTTWTYSASGQANNWNFIINSDLEDNQNIKLPDEMPITDLDIAIVGSTGDYEIQSDGFSSSLENVQRGYYKVIDINNGYTLDHTIYAVVNDGDSLSIPNLKILDNYPSLDAGNSTDIRINTLSVDSLTSDLKIFFMRENAANDLVSVVTKPAETKKQNQVKYMSSYTLLSR